MRRQDMKIIPTIGFGMPRENAPIPTYAPPASGLVAWLDASDTSASNIQNVGGLVSQWSDKSGAGNHATQGIAASQPSTGVRSIGSRNAIGFDGVNDGLFFASGLYGLTNGANTLFAVFMSDNANSSIQRIISGTPTGSFMRYGMQTTSTQFRVNHNTGSLNLSYNVGRDTAAHIGGMSRDGANLYAVFDGIRQSSVNANDFTMLNLTIGNNANLNSEVFGGAIGEMLIYNRALDVAEQNGIGRYLATKWGATWTDI